MKKLLLATTLLALSAGFASANVVRLATEGAYPPFNLIDDKGEVGGFEREFGDEICKRAALECTWSTNEWDSIIPNLQSGNYDVIVAGMSITDERKKVIDFTQDYYPPTPSTFVAASADADCKTGVVSAQVSTIQAAHVAETGMSLLEFPTPDETVAAVRNGEALCVFADSGRASFYRWRRWHGSASVGPRAERQNGCSDHLDEGRWHAEHHDRNLLWPRRPEVLIALPCPPRTSCAGGILFQDRPAACSKSAQIRNPLKA